MRLEGLTLDERAEALRLDSTSATLTGETFLPQRTLTVCIKKMSFWKPGGKMLDIAGNTRGQCGE